MNAMQMALHSWQQEKHRYEKAIKTVILDLAKPVKFIPSPDYEDKEEELKEYLKYHYTHQEEPFHQVYVQHIAGAVNMTLMELANKLIGELGGSLSFWQNKILDVASNTNYHPDLSIWEPNRAFEAFMGLSPQYTQNLRRKRSLAKNYLFCLTAICKLIDKSKANQEDLLRIDESFKKLKKAQEKYYAFMQEVEDLVADKNISAKGKNQAKSNLFMFLKPREEKIVNTLANYNFKVEKMECKESSKLLKGKQYQQFNNLFANLMKNTKSQRQSIYSDASQSRCSVDIKEDLSASIQELKTEFGLFLRNDKLQLQAKEEKGDQHIFIWSKDYFFTYWGFLSKYRPDIDFLQPFKVYDSINYEIDSEDQYDELNAEDISENDDSDQQSSESNNNSFVVDDDYISEGEGERDIFYNYQGNINSQRWYRPSSQLSEYEIICLSPEESQPLQLDTSSIEDNFIDKIEGKSKTQILSIFSAERKDFSKNKIETLLKANFKKIRNKNKQIVYVRANKSEITDKQQDPVETFSDQETNEIIEISVTCPTKPSSRLNPIEPTYESRQGTTESKQRNVNQTILEEIQAENDK